MLLSKISVINTHKFRNIIRSNATWISGNISHGTQNCNNSTQAKYICHKELFISIPSKPQMANKMALIIGRTNEVEDIFGRDLLTNGATGVMFAGENDTKGRKLIEEVGYDFGIDKAAYIKTNFTDKRLLENAFYKTKSHFRNIDIVINIVEPVETKKWETHLNRNIIGIVRSTLLAIDLMSIKKGGNGGIIVNAIFPGNSKEMQQCPVFVGAQHFLMEFAKSMSLNCYEETYVRVVTICAVGDNVECPTERIPRYNIVELIKLAKSGTIWTT